MGKEFTLEKMGLQEAQPVKKVNDLEAAANGRDTMSADAMGASASNSGNTSATLTDNPNQTWSKTHNENGQNVTYNYLRTQNVMPILDRVNTSTGEMGDPSPFVSQWGEQRMAVNSHDPANGRYKRANYVVQPPVDMKSESDTPTFEQLAQMDDAGSPVESIQGTLAQPNLFATLDNTLFIGNKTHPEDVRQSSVGDCYLLAAILQITHRDPHKIVDLMSFSGSQVTTTLFHKETAKGASHWVPTTIVTQYGVIARDNINPSMPSAQYVMGSRARVTFDPVKCTWISNIADSTLKIDKWRIYEAALWVNCLEQALTVFAQQYGKYGEGVHDNENTKEQFKAIENGTSGKCLHMFYGDQATDATIAFARDPSEKLDPVDYNPQIVRQLLSLAQNQDRTTGEYTHISVGLNTQGSVDRLQYFSGELIKDVEAALAKDPGNAQLGDALTRLKEIQQGAAAYMNAALPGPQREGSSSLDQMQIRTKIDAHSVELEKNTALKNLNPSAYDTLKKSIGTVVAFTQDSNGTNNIFIYSGHAYNIRSVNLVGKNNKSLNNASPQQLKTEIDYRASTLWLENPHGMTKPTYHEPEKEKNKGGFEITLEDFFNLCNVVSASTVTR